MSRRIYVASSWRNAEHPIVVEMLRLLGHEVYDFRNPRPGDSGTATAGEFGTATAGEFGVIAIQWRDEKAARYRMTLGYIGEGGIKPNVAYRCDETGKLVKA